MRLLLAVALAALAAPALAQPAPVTPAQSAIPHHELIVGAIENYIRPGFRQLAEETGSLATNVAALCAAPSAAALEQARDQFRSAVIAFSRVEFVRVGPLTTGDRLERLLFWPDRKGIGLRQVQQALASEDETAADPATLAGKSVAMQGLAAVEYLLFGTGAEALTTGDAYRCRYAEASVTLIAGLAQTIAADWDDPAGPSDRMLLPLPEYDDFRTELEVVEKLAATLVHGTEMIRDQRLTPILAGKAPNPRAALFWRSDMTVPALAANFAGLHDYFLAARFPEAVAGPNAWVANSAIFEFQNAARAAAIITEPLAEALADPRQLRALTYLVLITGSFDTIVGQDLAAALGLAVGFSALDRD